PLGHAGNHADPRSLLRVPTDARGRSASTLKSNTTMKRSLHGRNLLFVGVGAAALAIALALILVSVLGSSNGSSAPATTVSTSPPPSVPSAPAKAPGATATAALFRGIPQRLNQLGNPNAKVTMVEFADPQCPYCRQYALDALPAIVREYVRSGKVKLVFFGIP